MKVQVEVPKAFSVRDGQEIFAFQHLMQRLSPTLCVTEVAQGLHKEGGTTKFWGLVHLAEALLNEQVVLKALIEAGFDHEHNGAKKWPALVVSKDWSGK